MDITNYNPGDFDSMSYKELQKICKVNGVKGKKKVDMVEALENMLCGLDESSVIQVKRSSTTRKRLAPLCDISDSTGNASASPPCKVTCHDVGNSLYSEFDCTLRVISSTPMKIDLTDTPGQENKLKKFSSTVQENEVSLRGMINKFEQSAKPLMNMIESQRINLENNRCEGDNYLKNVLERRLKEKETTLKTKYDEEITQLRNEKDIMEKRCIEQQYTYKETAKKQNEAMLNIETERALLQKEIEMKDIELQKQIELTLSIELSTKHTTIEEMGDEFTCVICQELFLNATTVPCGHSFCEICLRTWFKTKKSCPVCRRNIKFKVVPSVTLDSAVEKIMEGMDEDTKRKRVHLKRERNEQKRMEDADPDPQGVRAMFHGVDDETETPAQQIADTRNVRRRSRSQSPAHNHIQQRANIAHVIGAVANNIHNNNNNNRNNHNNHQGNLYNQWRNNQSNYGGNYGNGQYGVRCFRCGANGHVSGNCTVRYMH